MKEASDGSRVDGWKIALSPDLCFYLLDEDVEATTRAAAALRDLGAVVDAWYAYWGVFTAASFGDLRKTTNRA